MANLRRTGLVIAGLILALALVARGVEAHERRQVGDYMLVVGFETEPALVEELNAAFITVARADGQPVEGVNSTLQVEVTKGGDSRTFDLEPISGRPGAYHAEFFPTETGGYVFRFFGTIDGQEVNERFESGPGRFDEVASTADLQFPVRVPSNAELAAQGQPGQFTASVEDTAEIQQALDRADSARTTGVIVGAVGIAIGLLGVALGAYALTSRGGRARSPGGQSEPV